MEQSVNVLRNLDFRCEKYVPSALRQSFLLRKKIKDVVKIQCLFFAKCIQEVANIRNVSEFHQLK